MPKRSNFLEPANSVIEAFGGCTRLGRILGISRAAVALWRAHDYRPSFQARGHIPEKHLPALVAAAKKFKIELEVAPYEVTIHRMGVSIKK